ncbi:tetratricopeptide repeat protein [Aminipila butyrica]|uniref:Tetratricopeptide repeat protein n=1 Tax=Aminipila butyrica TaxID=433296 RepID=A0A858BWQ1_9FIRM|nr:tetratricopeptide repeat protein [Aminipila butyrica]QIB69852.1 tetratricopeptide repeat protein [Aminipila butyrica]
MDLNVFFNELDSIFKRGNIKEAERVSLEWMEKAQKEGNVPAILAIANELGGIYRVTSRFEESQNAYSIALKAVTLLQLENTEQHGTTLLNLASVYAAAKNNQEALKLYEQAAAIYENCGLHKDYRLAALYNNISHVYDELNDLIQAERHAARSLEIIQVLPEFPIEMATTCTSLACIYLKQNRYHEAERNLFTAQQIFKNQGGKMNPHYAATLSALGELYYHTNQYGLAIQHFEQALELIKSSYGENISYVATCKNLAKVHEAVQDLAKRDEYNKQAAQVEERIRKI